MTEVQLALLNAGVEAEEATARNFRREFDVELDEFHVPTGEVPSGTEYDGFVVTGSRASVYEEVDWIANLKSWTAEAIEAGVAGIGTCFGHQLLADVLGGEIEPMGEYELGYRPVRHDGDSRLLADVPETFTAFASHSDRVTSLPPGASVIATNEYGVQGFRKGRVFGVQFHPEYDMEMARSIAQGKSDELPDSRLREVLSGIERKNYEDAKAAKRVFANFTDYVAEIAHGSPAK